MFFELQDELDRRRVPARLRYIDQGDAYGLRCLVEDMERRPRAVDFDEDAARLLGEHIQTRRRKRQRGIGPKWVRHGRDILNPDGAEEEYLAGLLKKAEAERESPRRGRPRKSR